jgi:magnesium transporter
MSLKREKLLPEFGRLFTGATTRKYVHPAQVAKIISGLPVESAIPAFLSLSENYQTDIFPYLDFSHQRSIMSQLPREVASKVLNGISSDDRVTFFTRLRGMQQTSLLELLNEKSRKSTMAYLGYPKRGIARGIDTNFATVSAEMTIPEAMEHLRKNQTDTEAANVIYVVDQDGKLIDDIPIRRLILNHPGQKIRDIMDGSFISLNIGDSKETAIHMFKEYDRSVLPVVNNDNVLLGVITVDDVLDIAEQEDTEDIQKFGGLEALDYPYVKTPFVSLIKKRAGWLVILFLSEMLTATAMGYFDDEIARAVVLALFVPLIISSGGNSGSQAATLIIRAMALKELSLKDWWYVMKREFMSGLTLGVILGSIGFVRIMLWQEFHWFDYGEHWFLIAITVLFSLIGIVMWGTLTGSMVPIILKRSGLDPAASSAPFVATLVDVTGLVIYFTIAAFVLKGTLL